MEEAPRAGTLVEFQWYVKKLSKPRGSLISPNFSFADLEWQLSIDGGDNGVYIAVNGRGVRAEYMISVVEGDLSGEAAKSKRRWVSRGFEEFGEQKWGCPGVMLVFYGKDLVVTAAFCHVISPVNHVSPDGGGWLVGIDHYGEVDSPDKRASGRPEEAPQRPAVPPAAAPAGGSGAPPVAGNMLAVPLARGVEPRILVEQCSPPKQRAVGGAAPSPDSLGSGLGRARGAGPD